MQPHTIHEPQALWESDKTIYKNGHVGCATEAGHSLPAPDLDVAYVGDPRSQIPSLHNQNFQWSTSHLGSLKQPVSRPAPQPIPHLLQVCSEAKPYSKPHPFPMLPVFTSVHGTDHFLVYSMIYLPLLLITIRLYPPECQLVESRFGLFCSSSYSQHLKQCLAHSWCSIHTCWIKQTWYLS